MVNLKQDHIIYIMRSHKNGAGIFVRIMQPEHRFSPLLISDFETTLTADCRWIAIEEHP